MRWGDLVERTAALRGGLSLPYAEGGSSSGIPVVLVHAYAESWRYVEPVQSRLPPSLHTYAPTQRGHATVQGEGTSFRLSDFASDVVDFMDAVGLASAVLVGVSSGGLVSQLVATAHPSRVAGLALISSPISLSDKPAVLAMRDAIMALSDPIDPAFVEEFVRSTSPAGMSDDLVVRLVAESLGVPARVWRDALQGLLDADLPVVLEEIRAATLLLAGSNDALVHDDQQVLLDRIPDAELVIYDGVGHGPHLVHPDRVAADLATFVNRLA